MAKTIRDKLEKQLKEWQLVYDREMKIVIKNKTATEFINGSHAMSANLKAANVAEQNIVRITKLLANIEDDEVESEVDKFL